MKKRQINLLLLSGSLLAFVASSCGQSQTVGAPVDELAFADDSTTSTGNTIETTIQADLETTEQTEAQEDSVSTETTAAPETTETVGETTSGAVAAGEISLQGVALEPDSEIPDLELSDGLVTETIAAFSAENLEWGNDTISVTLEESITGDVTVIDTYLAYVLTNDGVAVGTVEEVVGAEFYLDGVEATGDGYTCIAWESCPPGVSADDYETRSYSEITVSSIENIVGGCVVPTATSVRIDQC